MDYVGFDLANHRLNLIRVIMVCFQILAYELIWQGNCSPLFVEFHLNYKVCLSHSKKIALLINQHIWTGIYCRYLLPDFNLNCIRIPKLAPLIKDYWAFNDPQNLWMVPSSLAVCEMFIKRLIATIYGPLCFIMQSGLAQWREERRRIILTVFTDSEFALINRLFASF